MASRLTTINCMSWDSLKMPKDKPISETISDQSQGAASEFLAELEAVG